MYRVISEQRKDGPVYAVEDEEGHVMPGEFDSPINAQGLADYLNRRERMLEKNLKTWLRIRNVTMKALAEELHVTPGTLGHWIRTETVPPYIMGRISKILRVPEEKLIGG